MLNLHLGLNEKTSLPQTHDGTYMQKAIYLERHLHGGIHTRLIIHMVGAYTRRDIHGTYAKTCAVEQTFEETYT